MKIAVVCESYPSPGNQMMVFVEQLVHAIIDQGMDITVVAPQSLTNCIIWRKPILPYKNIAKTKGGKTYHVYRPKYFSFGNSTGLLGKLAFASKRNSIVNTLKKGSYDVIYSHFWEFATYTYQYCKKKNLPLFVACGEGDDALETMVSTQSEQFIKELKETTTGVISVSSENKRKCIDFNLADEKDIVVLPNCVDTELFSPMHLPELRKKLGIEDDDFVISFVGGFIERKGSTRLAAAIEKLNNPRIKSIFIGRTLSNDIAIPECKGIIHRGPLEHDLIPQYLNCSDVFVLPTQKEGCSNAIVEALSCGLPVISSDGSFNDDILTEENSIRINPNDVDAIADAIKQMMQNTHLKEELTNKMLNDNPYSLNARASKIIKFIKEKTNED